MGELLLNQNSCVSVSQCKKHELMKYPLDFEAPNPVSAFVKSDSNPDHEHALEQNHCTLNSNMMACVSLQFLTSNLLESS